MECETRLRHWALALAAVMIGLQRAISFLTSTGSHPSTQMWPSFWKPLVIVIPSAAIVLAVLYMTYRFIDPIPPRHLVIAAGMAGSGYDNFARQYARILARDGLELVVRNAADAVADLNLLHNTASGLHPPL